MIWHAHVIQVINDDDDDDDDDDDTSNEDTKAVEICTKSQNQTNG